MTFKFLFDLIRSMFYYIVKILVPFRNNSVQEGRGKVCDDLLGKTESYELGVVPINVNNS